MKIGGEVRKMNRRMVERIAAASPSHDTRIWSVIIVIKHDIYKSIVISGKRITKTRKVSLNKEIMMIMMMIMLLLLLLKIMLFYVIMSLLISYQTRARG